MSPEAIYYRCMWWDSMINIPFGNSDGAEEKCIEKALGDRSEGTIAINGGTPIIAVRNNGGLDDDGDGYDTYTKNIDVSAGGSSTLDTRRVSPNGPTNYGGGTRSYRTTDIDPERRPIMAEVETGTARYGLIFLIIAAVMFYMFSK